MRSVLRRKTRFWEWEKSGDLSSDRATRDGLSFMVTGTETWVAKYKSARQRMPVENSRLREQCAKSRISLGSSRDAASSKFLLKVPDSQPPPPPPPIYWITNAGVRPSSLCVNKPSVWVWCMLLFESHCLRQMFWTVKGKVRARPHVFARAPFANSKLLNVKLNLK